MATGGESAEEDGLAGGDEGELELGLAVEEEVGDAGESLPVGDGGGNFGDDFGGFIELDGGGGEGEETEEEGGGETGYELDEFGGVNGLGENGVDVWCGGEVGGPAGQDDDAGGGHEFAEVGDEGEAVSGAGEAKVHADEGGMVEASEMEGFGAGGGTEDLVAGVGEDERTDFELVGIVFDDVESGHEFIRIRFGR